MIKLVGSYDFSFNEAASRLIKCHSRGVDFSNFSKTASSDEMRAKIAKLKVAPDQTYVHVLAVGDTEKTGANRNADGFSGLWNKTAYEHFLSGHLFKHHKNDDPAKSVGKVAIAHYNEPMGRIELVIGMDNKKCAEEVSKVNKGEDIAVSMGCKVAHDVCSICDNKAKTPENYCDHMKTAAGKILDDGRVVYVDNPDPKYFDISIVHRPADRCAFSFNKVAGVNEWVSSVDLARAVGLTEGGTLGYNLKIASAIRKLSAMEKQVEGMIDGEKSKELASVLPVESDDSAKVCNDISKKLCSGDLKNVIASLADHRVLLTEADFFKIALGKGYEEVKADLDKVAAYLPGVYTRMLNDPSSWDVVESMTDGNKDYLALSVSDGVKKLAGYCRIDMSTVSKSVVKSLLSNVKVSNIKKAEDKNTSSSRFKALADIYASYKLATILLTDADAIMTKSVVVSNYLKV